MILINRIKAFTVNSKAEIWKQNSKHLYSTETWMLLVCVWELCITMNKSLIFPAFLFDLYVGRMKGLSMYSTCFNSLGSWVLAWLKANKYSPNKKHLFSKLCGWKNILPKGNLSPLPGIILSHRIISTTPFTVPLGYFTQTQVLSI